MRKLVLSIAVAIFGFPAFADNLDCTYETSTPDELFVQAVMQNSPDLNETQRVSVARMYELAYHQNVIVDNDETSVSDRELAKRTKQVAIQLAGLQLLSFETLLVMEDVITRMHAEEAAGLTKVSAELEPDVRLVARTMVDIALHWSDVGNDIVQLSADRFIGIADSGANIVEAQEAAEDAICTLQSVNDVMEGAVDFFPNAMALAYVENLYY
jgi:hypothetical protein